METKQLNDCMDLNNNKGNIIMTWKENDNSSSVVNIIFL